MVIAGKIRGNAQQLADYLLTMAGNERISILDVDGMQDADPAYLKEMLYSMELNSELTRSRNSVYHAYINPNPEDTTDRAMTMDEWQKSVDILTAQLGYEDQRRVVVLHEKPGNRVHAHVVYERYNHERGVMATYEHNYKAHDRARAEIEQVMEHKPTPQKNKNRDRHKQTLTQIWQRTKTAQEFIKEAGANGYKVAKGTNRPFRVIDENGVSFDLVRKLDGIKTKEVKTRFDGIELETEKQAIKEKQAAKQQLRTSVPTQEKETSTATQPMKSQAENTEELRAKFLEEIKQAKEKERNRSISREIGMYVLIALKVGFLFKGELSKPQNLEARKNLTEMFAGNISDITARQKAENKNTVSFQQAAKTYKPI
jgi:hypothetical protein